MSAARITAPVPGLNGVGVGGLQFDDSIAETDNQAIIDYAISAGYKVEPIDAESGKDADLSKLLVDQLEAIAAAEDIDLTGHKQNKQSRVDKIEAERKSKAEAEQYALDHTFIVTFKDPAGDEQTIEVVDEDEDAVRAQFVTNELHPVDVDEPISVEKKLTGEPAAQV